MAVLDPPPTQCTLVKMITILDNQYLDTESVFSFLPNVVPWSLLVYLTIQVSLCPQQVLADLPEPLGSVQCLPSPQHNPGGVRTHTHDGAPQCWYVSFLDTPNSPF